jgi:hypothetical protein
MGEMLADVSTQPEDDRYATAAVDDKDGRCSDASAQKTNAPDIQSVR